MTRARRAPGRHTATTGSPTPTWHRLVWSSVLLGLATAWLTWAGGLILCVSAPAVGGWRPYVVLTNSMRPGLAPGDVVLIGHDTAATERPLVSGDVALIADEALSEGTRLHRFVRTDPDGRVVTRGDANRDEDSPAPAEAVLGRARLIVPRLGLPLIWLRHRDYLPLGLVAVTSWTAVFVLVKRRPTGDAEDVGGGLLKRALPRVEETPMTCEVSA